MLPSGLSDTVADEEALARFLTSSGQFNSFMVKPAAFLPNPKDQETSVFRHGRQPAEGLWQIGREHAIRGRTLHGAAILKARHVRATDLKVLAAEPPPRHAAIVGWPHAADLELQKAAHKERAALLAQHAELVLA